MLVVFVLLDHAFVSLRYNIGVCATQQCNAVMYVRMSDKDRMGQDLL
jgi:hypothetical protein